MRRLCLLLVPAALFAGQARYARLGEFEGKVDVQLQAADPWIPAERNLPLTEAAWVRTGPASRLEIELDEGSAWRLGPDSQGEISDYTRLSTGQRVTLLSLDHGLAYFTGQPTGKDALLLVVPGAQVSLSRGARVRLEVQGEWSQISVIEGSVRFSSPAAELDLAEGQTTRVEPNNPARFFLYREVSHRELDRWSEERDQAEDTTTSAKHTVHRYGLADLDNAGEWIQTADLGAVWKPKTPDGWAPFQQGHWRWYDALGYTWVSDDVWGWLPYHYGRWSRREGIGWVWAPSVGTVFKPGEVYWLRGANLAGWGPLAPGEQWPASSQPQQFLGANTTYAAFQQEARVIDPAGFAERPKEPLNVTAFAAALPSPSLLPARLDAVRPVLRAGSTRVTPVLPGVTFPDTAAEAPRELPPSASPNPDEQPPVVVAPPPPQDPPPPIYYPPPVPNIVIVTPPSNPDYIPRPGRQPAPTAQQTGNGQTVPQSRTTTPAAGTPTTGSAAPAPQTPPIPRNQVGPDRTPRPPATSDPPAPAMVPVPDNQGTGRIPRPVSPPVRHDDKAPAPKKDDAPKDAPKKARDQGEADILAQLLKDSPEPARQLQDLDAWVLRYPVSEYRDDRFYYYMQAYSRLSPPQPRRVVEYGMKLMSKDLKTVFTDPQQGPAQILAVLYLMTVNIANVPNASSQQLRYGRLAAHQLQNYVPAYFAAGRRPPAMSDADWSKARADMEDTARTMVAALDTRQ
jgi:hypothetical protein